MYTPDIYQYCFVPEVAIDDKTFLTLMIKAKADTHLALAAHYGDLSKHAIEILIGTEGNAKSVIRDGVEGPMKSEALTMNILSEQVSDIASLCVTIHTSVKGQLLSDDLIS